MVRGTDTKALVFDLVRASDRTSRAELVKRTGLTGATISTITRRLLDEGLLEETGRAPSTGGKPRTFVSVVPDARYAVGVHLTRTDMVLVLTDLLGAIIGRTRREVAQHPGQDGFAQAVHAAVDEIIVGTGVDITKTAGAGVVVSGAAHSEPLGASSPEDLSRFRTSLVQAIGMPVLMDNDATAAALGEWWVSPRGRADDALVVYLGAGIGGGLLVGGRLQRGTSANAGELGHVCVDLNGPVCSCGARGCVEAIAGPRAVVQQALADPDIAGPAGLGQEIGSRGSVEADFAAVARVAHLGNERAHRLLDHSARALAVSIRSVVNVLDNASVILTGPSAAVAGAVYLPAIDQEVRMSYATQFARPIAVRLSQNCGTAAALGAAAMVLDSAIRSS
ncbi:ROK family transcriptional regulator [Actinomyces sp. MRS3W]|uniref:ROK family transcriptional regulator n=1 Tax=Actinomyces sp. MRS3W TaxID=2800796 RepID=UPI0028FD0E86|nr:ROK family transcriptional regulator [Actinomyces sp. MRS3W]MDU0349529.1 ROK family transcriptional regulator [Actinomyces sp. MRS3W]